MIQYQVICMYQVGTRRALTKKQSEELHTEPAIVMTLLNADQYLDRYVKCISKGQVFGYQSYRAGKRVTMADIV
jgi:hypothetical protein